MIFRLSYTILFFFLVLPKIPFGSAENQFQQQGFLLGEVSVLVYFVYAIVKRDNFQYFKFNRSLIYLLFFLFYFLIVSSIFSSIVGPLIIPYGSLLYFIRCLLYFLLIVPVSIIYTNCKRCDPDIFFYKLFQKSFLLHFVLSLIVFLFYNRVISPDPAESLWNANVGYRLVPLFGTTFGNSGETFIYSIGGSSGNLFATWALFVLVLVDKFEKNLFNKFFYFIVALFIILLVQSRGAFLTLSFFVLIRFISTRRLSLTNKAFYIFFLFFISIPFVKDIDYSSTAGLVSRLSSTFSDGEVDVSTAGRFENYTEIFSTWKSNILFVLWGIGYDSTILEYYTGWTLVESFFLSVLFSSGFFGLILFIVFLVSLYKTKMSTKWSSVLWTFIAVNCVFNWSVTGGDFLSPVVLYIIVLCSMLSVLSRQKKIDA